MKNNLIFFFTLNNLPLNINPRQNSRYCILCIPENAAMYKTKDTNFFKIVLTFCLFRLRKKNHDS